LLHLTLDTFEEKKEEKKKENIEHPIDPTASVQRDAYLFPTLPVHHPSPCKIKREHYRAREKSKSKKQ